MSDKPAPPLQFHASSASQLACPACHGDLCFENLRLICAVCGRAYPFVDGIPVLIIDRAEKPGESSAG